MPPPSPCLRERSQALLKGELVAIGTDADGILQGRPWCRVPVPSMPFTAKRPPSWPYGAVVEGGNVTFRLWAPTAKSVQAGAVRRAAQVAWRARHDPGRGQRQLERAGGSDLVGKYYRYDIQVYHPVSRKLESYQVTDPLLPEPGDELRVQPGGGSRRSGPQAGRLGRLKGAPQPEEPRRHHHLWAHVRDLTGNDESTPVDHRGKFLGLTDSDSVPVTHLKSLAKSGVSLHLLPVFDIATVNEDPAKVANIGDDFSKLCEVNPEVKNSRFASHCGGGETIEAVLGDLQASDSKENPVVQELYGYLRGVDSFSWGYDPTTTPPRKAPTPPMRRGRPGSRSSARWCRPSSRTSA